MKWDMTTVGAFGDDVEDELRVLRSICKSELGKSLEDTFTVDSETTDDIDEFEDIHECKRTKLKTPNSMYHYYMIEYKGNKIISSNWDGIQFYISPVNLS